MQTIKRILIPTDFSECSKNALRYAVRLAEFYQADLDVFHVSLLALSDPYFLHGIYYPDHESVRLKLKKQIASELQKISNNIPSKIKARTEYTTAYHPVEPILKYSEQNEIDLIVMGTQGRGGFERKLIGSTAEEVVRHSKRPVITLKDPILSEHRCNTILLPYDFSSASKEALKHAVHFAERFKSKLVVLHVVISPNEVQYMLSNIKMGDEIIEESNGAMKKNLSALIPDGMVVDYITRIEKSTVVISDIAKSLQADMIIMATHGYTGVKHFFMGSTAEKILRTAPCPLFVFKPNE